MVLANWRITHLLLEEEGPFDIFGKLRARLGVEPDSYRWKITVCHLCLSVWIAPVVYILPLWANVLLAVSTGSILVEDWYGRSKE